MSIEDFPAPSRWDVSSIIAAFGTVADEGDEINRCWTTAGDGNPQTTLEAIAHVDVAG